MSEIRELRELHLDSIRIDPALQPRVMVDQGVVAEYADAMEAGDTFPAIVVFHDGTTFWLADGWHRVEAARSVRDKRAILAEVHDGTRRDALLYSLGANAAHGLRRSNEDKRKAVERVLADPEWAKWSDREIARLCRVSNTFVSSLRKTLSVNVDRQRAFERGGTVATMNTAPIAAAAEARVAESMRTETLVVPFGKDAELIAKVRTPQESGSVCTEPEALYRDLERAVYDYLGPPDAHDQNLPARIAKLDALMADEFSEAFDEFEPYIGGKPYRKEELTRCFTNVRHMLGDKLRHREYVKAREAEKIVHVDAPSRSWAPTLTPVEREKPEMPAEPEPEPEPMAAREPSSWAPALTATVETEEQPATPQKDATIHDIARRVVALADEVIKRGLWPATYKPALDLAEASGELARMVLEHVYGEASGPDAPQFSDAMRVVERSPMEIGVPVQWGDKIGTLIGWKAQNRTAEVEDQDGKRYSMPAFMVKAIIESETA